MIQQRNILRLGIICSLLGFSGCLHHSQNASIEVDAISPITMSIPQPVKGKIYTFLINGVDVIDVAKFYQVRDHMIANGYRKTYFAQMYHSSWYADEIRQIRAGDPEAKIVLIGYDHGASVAESLVNELGHEGHPVDLLIRINPKESVLAWSEATPSVRTITIQSDSFFGFSSGSVNSHSLVVPHSGHLSVVRHPATLAGIVRELDQVAMSVTWTETVSEPLPALVEPVPAPRTSLKLDPLPPEWDFLRLRRQTKSDVQSLR